MIAECAFENDEVNTYFRFRFPKEKQDLHNKVLDLLTYHNINFDIGGQKYVFGMSINLEDKTFDPYIIKSIIDELKIENTEYDFYVHFSSLAKLGGISMTNLFAKYVCIIGECSIGWAYLVKNFKK